ncbi:M48 family metalloprotease [Dechloromonas sp. XY25]|uniref:M48 family metalloprotease n=1 Tax=Dechloromonas hankyongensis TaxID=2908002 RepID=A0ABS9K693_9RHOO|nr:M48 family metalloprotease [Dechloromonas hankyongensis]MCG2578687.1 M48 family metalloprotease [Dechloromonas hankyongensis]
MAGCLGAAGCAVDPPATPKQLIDMPIASAYADATFTLNTMSWRNLVCTGDADECTTGPVDGERFTGQVRRVGSRLQEGAQRLYPDLEQRIPNVAAGRFDIQVVDADGPGSSATANGRIALNSGLAAEAPDDAWVAFVIAREMGHVIARHPEERSVFSLLASLVINIAIPGSGLIKTAISTAGSALAAGSKQTVQGREADTIARRLLTASGYPLRDVARSLQNTRPLADDGSWAKRFRKSAADLMAEARTDESPLPASPGSPAEGRKQAATPPGGLALARLPAGSHAPNGIDVPSVPLNRPPR